MAPPEALQLARLQRLGADRERVHPSRTEGGQVADLVGSGVGFQRDLGPIGDTQAVGDLHRS